MVPKLWMLEGVYILRMVGERSQCVEGRAGARLERWEVTLPA